MLFSRAGTSLGIVGNEAGVTLRQALRISIDPDEERVSERRRARMSQPAAAAALSRLVERVARAVPRYVPHKKPGRQTLPRC